MRYGYVRTPTSKTKRDDRQRNALIMAGVDPDLIFSDHTPGPHPMKNRPGWRDLMARIDTHDELVIWRLGIV